MIKLNKKFKYELEDSDEENRQKNKFKLRKQKEKSAKIQAMKWEEKISLKKRENNMSDNKTEKLKNFEEDKKDISNEELNKLNELYPEKSDLESVNITINTYRTEKTNSMMNTNDVVSSRMDGEMSVIMSDYECPLEKFMEQNNEKATQQVKFTQKDYKKLFSENNNNSITPIMDTNKLMEEYTDKEMDEHIDILEKEKNITKSNFNDIKTKIEDDKNIKKIKNNINDEYKVIKNNYTESKEINRLSEAEVAKFRIDNDNIKVKGNNIPNPISTWYHCGFKEIILDYLVDKLKFKNPFPIQCQSIPIIISGRDCINIAETGSGKTLSFIWPLIKHIKSQNIDIKEKNPIGLIIVPTRELAMQIYNSSLQFFKLVNIKSLALYGGENSQNQISILKKGVNVIIATPAKLIDILSINKSKITNLNKVSYVVLDECDRLFDFGFENQIKKILDSTNKNRQIVLFSATFPKNVEKQANNLLNNPIEIIVGSRGQVNRNIKQIIKIINVEDKFIYLLKILGENQSKGKILIFLHEKIKSDELYKNLLNNFYKPFWLHSDQNNDDRINFLKEYIEHSNGILITTSVLSRGLDIENIYLIINYDCPKYKEDYIHRVGRTGRAGKTGVAITFITPDEQPYSDFLIEALQKSNQNVEKDLIEFNEEFKDKIKSGEIKNHKNKNINLQSKGYQFDFKEKENDIIEKNKLIKKYGLGDENIITDKEYGRFENTNINKHNIRMKKKIKEISTNAAKEAMGKGFTKEQVLLETQKAVKDYIISQSSRNYKKKDQLNYDILSDRVSKEFEIKNYPDITRNKVTNKILLDQISELSNCTISIRGAYCDNYKEINQKALHLYIEGNNEEDVNLAYIELRKFCEESANNFFK